MITCIYCGSINPITAVFEATHLLGPATSAPSLRVPLRTLPPSPRSVPNASHGSSRNKRHGGCLGSSLRRQVGKSGLNHQQWLYIYLSIYLSIHPSIHPAIHQSINPSIYTCVISCNVLTWFKQLNVLEDIHIFSKLWVYHGILSMWFKMSININTVLFCQKWFDHIEIAGILI
jgi:hypothetical protein